MEVQSVKGRRHVRRSVSEIMELLSAHEASGQSQRAFCQARGISVGSFALWRRRYGRKAAGTGPEFAEVSITGSPVCGCIAVRLVDGTEVFFPSHLPAKSLAEYIVALRGERC